MSGKASRDKGCRGNREAKQLLTSRDWNIADLASGIKCEDLLATDTDGNEWCVEVKNTVDILQKHKKQAMEQAKKRGKPWMLMNKITGTSGWLIQRQGYEPVVWRMQNNIDKG